MSCATLPRKWTSRIRVRSTALPARLLADVSCMPVDANVMMVVVFVCGNGDTSRNPLTQNEKGRVEKIIKRREEEIKSTKPSFVSVSSFQCF